MTEAMFWGFLLRLTQAITSAAPFIIVGFLVAAIFRVQIGAGTTRRLFGLPADPAAPSGRWRPLLHAWVIGMLLPICSLGAIPVARELRRIGLPAGTILAFAMTAPLFNPLSLLYGLTLSEPIAILSFAGCSLVIVTVLGSVFDRLFPSVLAPAATGDEANEAAAGGAVVNDSPAPNGSPAPLDESITPGWRRIVANIVAMLRDMASASGGYILVGLLGVSLLGAILPKGAMQMALESDDPLAIPRMLGMSIPVYATPMLAMSQLGMMFSHVNSIGAAFVLLVLGAGMNIGLLAWMVREYGAGKSALWFGLLISVVVGLAYAVDGPLTPKGIEPAGHTHAFDIYCRPYAAGTMVNPRSFIVAKMGQTIPPYERQATYILLALVLLGGALQLADRSKRIEAYLGKQPAGEKRMDVIIPGPLLGGAVLLLLVALSIVGCYAYYPPADEVFEEMRIVRGEALSGALTGQAEQATYWIAEFDDWSRKLEVGTYLREGELSDFQRMKGRLLREKLELLEHEVEDMTGPAEPDSPVRHLMSDVGQTYTRLRNAYGDGLDVDDASE